MIVAFAFRLAPLSMLLISLSIHAEPQSDGALPFVPATSHSVATESVTTTGVMPSGAQPALSSPSADKRKTARAVKGSSGAPVGKSVSAKPPVTAGKSSADSLVPTQAGSLQMPGLGATPGKSNPMKQTVVYYQGGTEVVHLSSNMPNRIATPFSFPQVIDLTNLDVQRVGQDVYISLLDPEQPVAVFIREKDMPASPVIALTLVPKPIPAQNISVLFTEGFRRENGAPLEADEISSDYVSRMKSLMRSLVTGLIPSGFVEADLAINVARVGDVMVVPERLYAGQSLNIYRLEAQNIGREPIELTEPNFYRDGVRAVAFWPRVKLDPNQTTAVYVIADKLDEARKDGGKP